MTADANGGENRVFLASDRIWPSAINATYPGARFVARARMSSAGLAVAPAFEAAITGEVWGVLIEVPDALAGGNPVRVVADDGTESEARLGAGQLLEGDPESVFMASRYWELDPAFVQELRLALQARGLETSDEEPRDDGALDTSAPAGV